MGGAEPPGPLHRAYLALIVLVEGVPRGYDPQARAPLTDLAAADLMASLDLLRHALPGR